MARSKRKTRPTGIANEAYMRGMQELRRSNAAQPIPAGKHKGSRSGNRKRAIADASY